jgi:hypothetical protein
MGTEFLGSQQLLKHARISQHLMELVSSLQCSQAPANGLYPLPDESNQLPYSVSIRSTQISYQHLHFPNDL